MSNNISAQSSTSTMADSAPTESTTDSCDLTSSTDINALSQSSVQTKRLFAECALVEIIHLHDCLRGALQKIQSDVDSLVAAASVIDEKGPEHMKTDLSITSESKVSGEDSHPFDINGASELSYSVASRFHLIWSVFQAHSGAEDEFIWPALKMKIESKKQRGVTHDIGKTSGTPASSSSASSGTDNAISASSSSSHSVNSIDSDENSVAATASLNKCGCESFLEAEAYEEDHAHEETMFKQINTTLRRLNGSFRYYHANRDPRPTALLIIKKVILLLKEQTDNLNQHLTQHLAKEETQCLPMVKKHLTKDEISELVGNIMGKRSAEMMGKILNLAVCSLPQDEREDMVKCMKKAMGGTFFEKWLTMGGWNGDVGEKAPKRSASSSHLSNGNTPQLTAKRSNSVGNEDDVEIAKKKPRFQGHITDTRLRYPSRYYVDKGGETVLVWNSSDPKLKGSEPHESVPKFAQSELTPTFRFSDSKGGMVLGCEHYSRSCKLRHPDTGQLFTCRLCCEEVRQKNIDTHESLPVLDRHAVSEIYCMKCFSLQPAGEFCANKECDAAGEPFAKFFCSICNLYENDESKKIYHCPYCNVCRKGEGLGIDFRHCMRCNACISMAEFETHVCIPQRLQGNCAICKESMFESTEPLRGMKCGHVMHLSCYNQYAYRSSFLKITCPTCRKVFDNMRG